MDKARFWQEIDIVLLDMDGTLLDRHFDDYFWEQYLPEHYSLLHDLPFATAKEELLARYHQARDSLDWADLDFWSEQLGFDLAELKARIASLICIRPHVIEFLRFCRQQGKVVCLVTNAHNKSLRLKLQQSGIGPLLDQIVCAEEIGWAKEEAAFWPAMNQYLPFDRKRSLLIDDSETVLSRAFDYGIRHLRLIARPSSRQDSAISSRFEILTDFRDLL